MQKSKRSEILEFGFLMGRHAPGCVSTWWLHRILRHAARYGRFAEEQCNRELSDTEMVQWKDKTFHKIMSLCEEIGCKVKFQDDPRGATVKIVVPDGFTNDWGQTGICVPTS